MVGWRGVFSVWITFIIIVLIKILSEDCSSSIHKKECFNDAFNMDFALIYEQFKVMPVLLILNFANMLALGVYIGFRALTIKLTSSAVSVVAMQSQIPVVLSFFLLYQGEGHEELNMMKILGIAILVPGVLFYTNLIAINSEWNIVFLPSQQDSQQTDQI